MRGSISRQALVFALAVALPATLVVHLYVADARARLLSLVAAALGMVGALVFARSFERRIRRLTAFIDHLQDPDSLRPRLAPGDDELGDLARSLSRMASRMDDLVNRLSTELTRREAILASMTEAVLAVDSRLNVTFCNNSFIRAVGDHGNFEGLPLIRVVRDPGLIQILKQVLDTGETVRRHLKLSVREDRSYDVYAAPLASGFSRGAIATLHDVTPIERLERAKRDFIANVSHEFRTPLATIRGYAETLLDGGLEDEQNRRRFVEIIQANGVRLSNIAADLLTLSELEAGAPGTEPGQIGRAHV
jgi:two-component system phosphate regulon sensor histidine kinase PhoR